MTISVSQFLLDIGGDDGLLRLLIPDRDFNSNGGDKMGNKHNAYSFPISSVVGLEKLAELRKKGRRRHAARA